ncbi:discoidin domain-containing protein [Bacteroides sp. 1001136B_160425_E2]|uniref:discoidin domain-containing protein n=1 Tax=Bacteroides sp. 1001136B_160425_E2 TaxID=2787083 RepID=UPI00189C5E1A|nr:discoidin domain-containing protein [Bacteroides sp. 1001136B_160425_E2]
MIIKKILGLVACSLFTMEMAQAVEVINENEVIYSDLDRTGWVVSASNSRDQNRAPEKAIDNNLGSRWASGILQEGGEWFMVDMRTPQSFNVIELNQGKSLMDYPRGYEVYISNDGKNWGEAIVTGKGTEGKETVITLPKVVESRYVKIVQTGIADGNWWSIHEFYLKMNK